MPGRIPDMDMDELIHTLQWNNRNEELFVLELNQMQFLHVLSAAREQLRKDNAGEKYIYSPAGEIIEQIRSKRDASQHLG